ncbi:hypothetical protein CFP56_034949 [Quercus suber]|uniref:Uncharacterized protein n=1 Tax=Quercus suber TaxID=58331 RepID=A0AAW0JBI3_QUESU
MVVVFLKSCILKAVRLVKVMSILLGKAFSSCNLCFVSPIHGLGVAFLSLFSPEKLRNYRTFRNDEVLLDMRIVL